LYFNPTKIVAETLAGGNKCNSILKTVSTHFINNRGELKKTHHTGIEILEEAGVGKEYKSNWSSCAIVTHKPLEGQSYFSYLRNASQQNNESSYAAQALKNQYIVTNNVSHTNSVQDGPTKNFIPSQHELRQLRDLTLLQRSIAKPGIYLQNGIEKRYMFPKENYYASLKNYGELTNDKNLIATGEKLFKLHNEALNEIDPRAIIGADTSWENEEQANNIILLKHDPFVPSGSKNHIHGALENAANRSKLLALQSDQNVSQEEIAKFVNATNKSMLKKYDYSDIFKNATDFEDL